MGRKNLFPLRLAKCLSRQKYMYLSMYFLWANTYKDCFSKNLKTPQQICTDLKYVSLPFSLILIYLNLLFFRLRTILTHSRPNRDIHCQSSTGSIVLFNDRQNNQRRQSFVPLIYEPKKLVKTSSRQFSSLLQQRRRPIHFIPPNIPPGSRGLGWVRKNY